MRHNSKETELRTPSHRVSWLSFLSVGPAFFSLSRPILLLLFLFLFLFLFLSSSSLFLLFLGSPLRRLLSFPSFLPSFLSPFFASFLWPLPLLLLFLCMFFLLLFLVLSSLLSCLKLARLPVYPTWQTRESFEVHLGGNRKQKGC